MAKTKAKPVTEVKISDAKKKQVVLEMSKANSILEIKNALADLEPAERNALAFEIAENIDRIVKPK